MPKRIIDIIPPTRIKEIKREVKIESKITKIKPARKQFSSPKYFPKKILIVPFLLGLGVLAYFTLSKAEISIWPLTETVALEKKLTVQGTLFSVEKTISGEFIPSGKKFLEQKAAGQIRIYNNYQSDQVLVANTRLQAPLEKFSISLTGQEKPWFRTLERIIIPAKKPGIENYVDVKVVADSPGEKYNIEPSKFSIPGLAGTSQYTQIYGESLQAFTGGQRKEVSQATKDDLKSAENQLKEQGTAQNRTDLMAQIPSELEFLEDSFKTIVLATSSLVKVGDQVPKFNFQVKIKSEVLAFNRTELEGLAKGMIVSAAAEGKKIDEASFKNISSFTSFDSKTKDLALSVTPSARIYSDIDKTSLSKRLSGLSLAEAKLLLENQPQIEKSQIKLWPFWQRKIPKDVDKIKIELKL